MYVAVCSCINVLYIGRKQIVKLLIEVLAFQSNESIERVKKSNNENLGFFEKIKYYPFYLVRNRIKEEMKDEESEEMKDKISDRLMLKPLHH